MYLEELIENVELESDKFECKSRLNREDVVGWLKSIAGFANASGGDFYIGVEDKTNKLIGFDRTEADNERNYFNNQVNEHLSPRPQMKLSFLRYMIKEKERFIIQLYVTLYTFIIRIPNRNRSRKPPEKVRPTAMFKIWAII